MMWRIYKSFDFWSIRLSLRNLRLRDHSLTVPNSDFGPVRIIQVDQEQIVRIWILFHLEIAQTRPKSEFGKWSRDYKFGRESQVDQKSIGMHMRHVITSSKWFSWPKLVPADQKSFFRVGVVLEFEFGIVKSYMTIFYTNGFHVNPEFDLLFFMLEQIMLRLFVIIHRFDNALKRFLTSWNY